MRLKLASRWSVLVGAGLVIALLVAGGIAGVSLGLGRQGAPVQISPQTRDTGAGQGSSDLFPGAAPFETDGIPAGRSRIRVPILEYHYVRVNGNPLDRLGYRLSVTPADFQRQMTWLAVNGYHPVFLADLRGYFVAGQALPARSVVLTFDDGYADFFQTAFPILRRLGFKAVAYIVPGFLGRPGYLDQDQVLQLDASGMVEIASHTVNHLDLTKVGESVLNTQLQASRGSLEQLLGHPILDFCYPSGRFNGRVVAAVSAAGYQTATTEQAGTEHDWPSRLTWSRTRVDGGEDLEQFALRLGIPETPSAGTKPFAGPPGPLPSPVPSGPVLP
jgi:peptidoglycan/xylan/chitin deacetylase (PgdA/CDA1 family)